jgi:hypothetical protein
MTKDEKSVGEDEYSWRKTKNQLEKTKIHGERQKFMAKDENSLGEDEYS